MYTINEVPTTCTAKHITDWNNRLVDQFGRGIKPGTPEFDRWLYLKVKEFDRLATGPKVSDRYRGRHAYWLDHAYVFVTITKNQLEIGNKYVLDALGFQEVFCGKKNRHESREKDTGALYMFVANPEDLEERCQKVLKSYEKVHTKKGVSVHRNKFTPITLENLKRLKFIGDATVEGNTISWNSLMGVGTVDKKAVEHFGVGFVETNLYNRTPIATLEQEHKDWKKGLPNVFEN